MCHQQKFRTIALALGLFGASFSLTANAFVLTGEFWPRGEADIHVDLSASNPPGANQPNVYPGGPSTETLQNAYIEAINIWTNVSTFRYTATVDQGAADPCPAPAVESRNGVKFSTTNCAGAQFSDSTLAVQQSWSSGNSTTKTGTIFNNNLQWDIYSGDAQFVFDGGFGVFRNEFRRVAVHELGHGLGLDHEPVANAIMEPIAGDIETPQTDDRNGAAALYDLDSDGVGFAQDNCPALANPDQSDVDVDNIGDDCDADIDGDGIFNAQTIDQSIGEDSLNNSFNLAGNGTANNTRLAQTFTIGVSGTLDRIALPFNCDQGDNLVLTIRSTSGGNPTSTTVAGVTINDPPDDISGFVEYDLTDTHIVSAGEQYVLIMYSNGRCYWNNSTENYGGGRALFSSTGVNWFNLNEDLPLKSFVTPAAFDNCPFVSNPLQQDSNNNGVGDVCDGPGDDPDNDGVSTEDDNCAAIPNPGQENNDGDMLGDACDTDDDNDNVNDGLDNCPFVANTSQTNSDNDNLGNACDPNDDNDARNDIVDNCPLIANNDQLDNDGDMLGDVCDPDDDNDNVNDDTDNCPLVSNGLQENNDQDLLGNVCDPDDDNDNVPDTSDNCPFDANFNQLDTNEDDEGDACDSDDDGDGVPDIADNCPLIVNPLQENNDTDPLGDACQAASEVCFPVRDLTGNVSMICF